MDREEIIRMAREAGYAIRNLDGEDEVMDGDNYHIQTDKIEHLVAIAIEYEREACAKVCDSVAQRMDDMGEGPTGYIGWVDDCAAAIRARTEK